jgi:hypothetical protein
MELPFNIDNSALNPPILHTIQVQNRKALLIKRSFYVSLPALVFQAKSLVNFPNNYPEKSLITCFVSLSIAGLIEERKSLVVW